LDIAPYINTLPAPSFLLPKSRQEVLRHVTAWRPQTPGALCRVQYNEIQLSAEKGAPLVPVLRSRKGAGGGEVGRGRGSRWQLCISSPGRKFRERDFSATSEYRLRSK
jgi:hypothetical protein